MTTEKPPKRPRGRPKDPDRPMKIALPIIVTAELKAALNAEKERRLLCGKKPHDVSSIAEEWMRMGAALTR